MTQQSHSWRKLHLKKVHAPRTWKQPQCPLTDEWIKMCYIHTMEYYSAIKKNETMPFAATWMDLDINTVSEISQRKTKISYDITTCEIYNI